MLLEALGDGTLTELKVNLSADCFRLLLVLRWPVFSKFRMDFTSQEE